MLTREESKEFLPIIQAFAEGKTIQVQETEGYWRDLDVLHFNYDTYRYRIKPELKYRSFKDADECWKEMQKHQPFGWVIDPSMQYRQVIRLSGCAFYLDKASVAYEFREVLMNLTFADGEPFGVKQE